MEGFHPVKYLHVGGVAIGRGDKKMTETSSKKVKKLELVSIDNQYCNNNSAYLMPDLTGPRAHDDHGDHR